MAQVSVGAIGVVILIVARFRPALPHYPPPERAALTLKLFVAFCGLVGSLTVAAAAFATINRDPTPEVRDRVSVGFGETQFQNLLPAIESRFNVTVSIQPSCDAALGKTMLRGGTIEKKHRCRAFGDAHGECASV